MTSSASLIVRIIALAIAYYVIGRIGLLLAVPPGYATIIWPPSGIALAALILWGGRAWPGIAIGSFVLNVMVASGTGTLGSVSFSGWLVATAIALGSAAQALAIRVALRQVFGSPISLHGWRDVIRLLFIAGPCGCIIAATIGTTSMWLAHGSDNASFLHNWMTWWAGDALGVVIFMPLVLLATANPNVVRWRGGELGQLSASAFLVVLIPLGLTFYAWDLTVHFIYERNAARFAALAKENETALLNRINSYEQALRGAAGFFKGSDEVLADEWNRYVQELDLPRNLPGMIGLGWISEVGADQLATFVSQARARGNAGFTIHPQGGGNEYFVITHVEPIARNREALGLNVAFEANRRGAAILARDTGKPTITHHIQLVQEHSRGPGFLMLLPVYKTGMSASTPEQRRAALQGWVYAALSGQLMSSLTNAQGDLLDLSVFDEDADDVAQIYATRDDIDAQSRAFALRKNLAIGQQRWSVRWSSTPAFERAITSYEPTLILGAGLTLSTLFGAFALVMSRREQRVQEQVNRRTVQLRTSEAALRSSEETFRAAMEHAPFGMALVDPTGRFIKSNQSLSRIVGYSPQELQLMQFQSITHPDDLPSGLETLQRALRGEIDSYQLEKRYIRKDGETIWIQLYASVIRSVEGNPQYLVGQMQDITQRREVDRLKSEFISTVSHELRTPLTSIRGSLGLLVGGALGSLPEKAAAMVRIAHSNSERLIAIINDILDIEKIESGRVDLNLSSVALSEFLQESLTSNQGYGTKYQVTFQLEPVNSELGVRADSARLAQVMANLLSNAAKFSKPGDVVQIRARRVEDRVAIEVEDHGAGIPDEFKPRVFEKFAQADASSSRRFEGTGLGLSITKQLIEAMHGRISFRSSVGIGTTFTIELPASVAANEVRGTVRTVAPTSVPAVRSTPPCVLHVEDDADFSSIIAAALGGRAQVIRTASVDAAQDLLSRHDVALLLLDPGLPGDSGLDLLAILDREGSKVPVIVLSASELNLDTSALVRAVLVKSRTSEARIVQTILDVLGLE